MKKSRAHPEDDECQSLWQWAQHNSTLREYLYHIPNGGKRNRNEAARMNGMGVRPGVHDYHLPVARGGFIGLWIEMKAAPPHQCKVTDNQKKWGRKMEAEGHAVFFCRGWLEARDKLRWYLQLPSPESIGMNIRRNRSQEDAIV